MNAQIDLTTDPDDEPYADEPALDPQRWEQRDSGGRDFDPFDEELA